MDKDDDKGLNVLSEQVFFNIKRHINNLTSQNVGKRGLINTIDASYLAK